MEHFNKNKFTLIAGPCSVENYNMLDTVVSSISSNVDIVRGGVFKPRTKPTSFQGLGIEGLEIMKDVCNKYNKPIITELMDDEYLDLYCNDVDIIQIGSRNMQNFSLLKKIAAHPAKPTVMLKRGFANTIDEFLSSAEYLSQHGNHNIILCERGIRGFDSKYTRNILDLSSIPVLKNLTKYPVIIDPSHGTGHSYLIEPMINASIAAGADGIIVEVHPTPETALSDSQQQITPDKWNSIVSKIKPLQHYFNQYYLTLNTELSNFQTEGYFIKEKLFSDSLCLELKKWIEENPSSKFANECEKIEPELAYCHTDLFKENSPFNKLKEHEFIIKTCEEILQCPVELESMKVNYKQAWIGQTDFYHQDSSYINYCDTKDFVQIFIALDPIHRENGCLNVIPKSHTQGVFPHNKFLNINQLQKFTVKPKILKELQEKYGLVHLVMKPGDCLFFSHYLVHGSSSNLTHLPRKALVMKFRKKNIVIDNKKKIEFWKERAEFEKNIINNLLHNVNDKIKNLSDKVPF